MRPWLTNLFYRHARPLLAAAMLFSLVASTIGFPLPRRVAKDLSRPFPCMHSVCGCNSADACWKGCCCHTNQQKVAWGEKHGVEVPEFVLAAAREEQSSADLGHACCNKSAPPSPPQSEPTTSQTASCCHPSQPATPASVETDASGNSTTLSLQLVISEDYRRCHGTGSFWLLLSHAMPASVVSSPGHRLDLAGWLRPSLLLVPESPALVLETPPPNAIAAA